MSIGASVAMSQFGAESAVAERRKEGESFWGALAMALAGAVFFGFSVAATEEPLMIALRITSWHAIVIVLMPIGIVHLVVYAVEFRDRDSRSGRAWWQHLVKEGVSSYVVALGVAALLLWTFGRIGPDVGLIATVDMIVTLSFATRPDWLERGFSWASGALVTALLAYLAWDAQREASPTEFRVRVDSVVQVGEMIHVPVRVDTLGHRAAQTVEVTVTLRGASDASEGKSFTLDWLAGKSTRRGMAVFPRGPEPASRATAQVTGFAVP